MSVRTIATSIAVGLSVAALSLGTSVAAPQAAKQDPYPESEGWRTWHYDFVVPAGSACNVAVRVTIDGHIRFLVNGRPMDDDYVNKAGDVIRGNTPDVVFTFTNEASKKKPIVAPVSPRHYREVVSADGTALTGRSVGRNVYFGPGVRGILYADGVQRYTYRHISTADETLDIWKTEGTTVELCRRLGGHPVEGRLF